MPHVMYHRVPCSQKLAAVPTNQDLPEYRTTWPRVRWCVGVAWCSVSTMPCHGQSATAQPSPAIHIAPCVAFRGHIQEVLLDLPCSSTLRSFAELAVSSLVKYSLETMLRLLIWRFDAFFISQVGCAALALDKQGLQVWHYFVF